MSKKLAGQVAVVTGASKGIGAEIALRLAAEGAAVVVNYASSKQGADRVVAEITGGGGKALAVQANIAKPADIQRLFAEAKKAFGRLDILVNNAGIYEFAPLESVTPEHFHKHFDLNVLGLILATQEAARHFGPQGGSVVNISSVAATLAPASTSVYSATKAAVVAVTRSLAQELGPRKIRVNAVNPGMVETEGLHAAGIRESEFRKQTEAQTPLGPHRPAAGHRPGRRVPGLARRLLDHRRNVVHYRRAALRASAAGGRGDLVEAVLKRTRAGSAQLDFAPARPTIRLCPERHSRQCFELRLEGRLPLDQHRAIDPYAQLAEAARRGVRATALGISVSVILATIKIIAGVVGNAYALIADGVESVLDVLSAAIVWGSLQIAASPPNERFPYGFGRIEPLAGLVVAITLLATAAGIAIQSVREIVTPHHAPAPFTLAVLVIVVVAKVALFRKMLRTGESIGSTAVRSDAWHHRSDALTSVAAFVGISISVVKGAGYESADDWAALFACAIIGWNGVRLFRTALVEVLDAAPSGQQEAAIRTLASSVAGVAAIEKCRIRKSGLGYFVELHVVVDGSMSVSEGHDIAHRVKDALLAGELGILDVVAHVEPAES